MITLQYADVVVLLYDKKRAVRKQTKSVLSALGFKTFLEFQELDDVRLALSNQRMELVILAVEEDHGDVLSLIDDVRRQRCGLDPFVPILLTAWDAKMNALRPIVESGADDVLLHPFSTAQLGERIETLVRYRKPFVVTEDYLGPDRRTIAALRSGPPPIIVPNALQAKVLDQSELGPTAALMNETLSSLRRLKLRNMARRIWYMANCLRDAQLDPTLPDRYDEELKVLGRSIQGYRKTLAAEDSADLRGFSDSLLAVVKKQLGGPPVARGLELLEQSALALRVASKMEYDQNDTGAITNEVISEETSKIGTVEADLIRAVMG
jgi:DNA-binding response OmpR family regulator